MIQPAIGRVPFPESGCAGKLSCLASRVKIVKAERFFQRRGSMSEVLREDPGGGVALVRINRPEARNALNHEVRRRLAEAFATIGADESVRVAVLTGNAQ